MKASHSICYAIVLAIAGTGCKKATPQQPARPDVLLRWHFAGTAQLSADTNAAWFQTIAALPASSEFKQEFVLKLARGPFQFLRYRIAGATNDYAELLAPLFADLISAESCGELRAVTNQPSEFALAVRLADERTLTWQTNLATVLRAWTGCQPAPLAGSGRIGWELKKHHAPNLIRFEQVGTWAIFGWAHDAPQLLDEYAAHIRAHGRPPLLNHKTNPEPFLHLHIDWPKAQLQAEQQLGVKLPLALPKLELTATSQNAELLVTAKLALPQPLKWAPVPWQIPTNTIREPLISFTACRGVAPLLQKINMLGELGLTPPPDQIYLWALQDIPFQTFVAVPVPNATNIIRQTESVLKERLGPIIQARALGELGPDPEATGGLIWRGLPFIGPYILPINEPTGEFLLFGLFPNTPVTNPPPPELYAQFIERPQIAYYDWEITHVRFQQLWNLCQLIRLIADIPQLNTQTAMWKWLDSVSTNLGNTATHITVDNPHQISLVRRSQLGLTAVELVAFANWFDSDGFPMCGLALPPHASTSTQTRRNTNAQTRR
ncbi:MAG: hypothetical protein NZ739_10930 [Verrucomicrobiae bacterium]|nr:hypothetical protein [Verrucomicrobiae bacterium]